MPTRDRTFSFRGSEDLAVRLDNVRAFLREAGPEERWIREVGIELTRALRRVETAFERQSDLLRETTEALVRAIERVQSELELESAYAEWAREDADGDEFRRGALAAGTEIWREE